MNRAARIAKQLGMSQGAANHRLKKQLLFHYVQKADGCITCSVCDMSIETVEEFSIEHIKPWEGRDASLFWDLDNIAFSHVRCNRPHVNGSRAPSEHGKVRRYHNGCRCDLCRKAKAMDDAKRRGRSG